MFRVQAILVVTILLLCFQRCVSVSKEKRSIDSAGVPIPFNIRKITSQKMPDNLLVFSVIYEATVPHKPEWFLHKHLPVFGPVDYDDTGRGPYWTATTRAGNSVNTTFYTTLSFEILFNRAVSLYLSYEGLSVSLRMNADNLKTNTYLEQNIYSVNYLPPLIDDLGDKISYQVRLFDIQSDIDPYQSYAYVMVYTIEQFSTSVKSRYRSGRHFVESKSDRKLLIPETARTFNNVLSPLGSIKINAEVALQFVSPKDTFAFDDEHTKMEEFQTAQGPYRLTRCAIIGSYQLRIDADPEPGSYFKTVSISGAHKKEIYALERNFTRNINFSCVAFNSATEISKVMNSV